VLPETAPACDARTGSAGARLLHIGPHKTGTTAIQGAFHLARERLAAHGVVYAGTDRQPMRATLAVTGRPAMLGESRPDMAYWDKLVRDVREAGDQRVVISSEFFADGDDATARRVVADLGGPRVHVVVTLRPLARVMPSQWQQYLQNGPRTPYLEWLDGMLRQPPYDQPTPTFWQRHRHDKLVARWAGAAGAQNVTVIVVDGSDRLALLRTFESLLGLPGGFLVPEDDVVNRSLTLAEAEFVRQLNEEFKRREWPGASYAKFMRYGAVRQMKGRRPLPGEPEIATPAWALERVAEISAEMTTKHRGAWRAGGRGSRGAGPFPGPRGVRPFSRPQGARSLPGPRGARSLPGPAGGGGSGGQHGGCRDPGGGRRAGRARGHPRGRDSRSGGGS
jgi:hypothetical protein